MLDKIFLRLIKSYFNYYHHNKKPQLVTKYIKAKFRRPSIRFTFSALKKKGSKKIKKEQKKLYFSLYHAEKKIMKVEAWRNKFRRSTLRQVFIHKAGLKHTNTKLIIGLDIYNLQLRQLLFEIYEYMIPNKKRIKKFYNPRTKIADIKNKIFIKFEPNNILRKFIKYVSRKFDINSAKHIRQLTMIEYYLSRILKYTDDKWKKNTKYYYKLKKLIHKIYARKLDGKIIFPYKIELRLFHLKYMFLNSDILSQAIALKLRDRDNRIWRILSLSLSMAELPSVINKFKERSEVNNKIYFKDSIKKIDLYERYISNKRSQFKDNIEKLIYGTLYRSTDKSRKWLWKIFMVKVLKYRILNGIRLEAKGRLTRRYKASRSIYKFRLKGGLRNLDPSYRGLSGSLLRGYLKPNVQYALTHSKNRIGAYGVKGWISGK